MRRIIRVLRLLVLISWIVSLLAISPRRAFACSCAAEAGLSIEEVISKAIDSAAAIFAGEVTDIRSDSNSRAMHRTQVKFHVSHVWKGDIYSQTLILTGLNDADCGYRFAVGDKYLVYAYSFGDIYATGICQRTMQWSEAALDQALLGVSVDPLPDTAPPTSTPLFTIVEATSEPPQLADQLITSPKQETIVTIVSIVGMALLIAIAAIWLYRRRSERHP